LRWRSRCGGRASTSPGLNISIRTIWTSKMTKHDTSEALKSAALKSCMIDLDALALADMTKVTLQDDGSVKGRINFWLDARQTEISPACDPVHMRHGPALLANTQIASSGGKLGGRNECRRKRSFPRVWNGN
jgi:hypothetical protein